MRISDWSSDVCSSDLRPDSREPNGRRDRHPTSQAARINRSTPLPDGLASGRTPVSRQVLRRVLQPAPGPPVGRPDLACLREISAQPGSRAAGRQDRISARSEEHTSELQSLMRISYAVFCLKKKKYYTHQHEL